jgi:hypothetical protein
MIEKIDDERMNYVCNKILENKKILDSNGKLWTTFLDIQLKEFVILYNFNFYEVANRFHDFMSMHKKYEFTEDEIRRHWSFLHAARYLNLQVDDEYYKARKINMREEEDEIKKEKERDQRRKKELEEEEKTRKEIEKYRYERFNLITINPEEDFKKKEKEDKLAKSKVENDPEVLDNEEIELEINEGKEKSNNVAHLKVKIDTDINENLFNDDDDIINNIFKNSKNMIKNLDIKQDYNIDDKEPEYEENLFPIKTNQNFYKINEEDSKPLSNQIYGIEEKADNYTLNRNSEFDKEIEKTKNIDDFIKEDENLRVQYDNLNTYYNFAVKSLNYFIPKLGKGLKVDENEDQNSLIQKDIKEDPFETQVIKKTSARINELFINSVKNF